MEYVDYLRIVTVASEGLFVYSGVVFLGLLRDTRLRYEFHRKIYVIILYSSFRARFWRILRPL